MQRSGLIQGSRLPFQERQVVGGMVDEVVPLVGTDVPGDDLGSAADDHLVHVSLYPCCLTINALAHYRGQHLTVIARLPHIARLPQQSNSMFVVVPGYRDELLISGSS